MNAESNFDNDPSPLLFCQISQYSVTRVHSTVHTFSLSRFFPQVGSFLALNPVLSSSHLNPFHSIPHFMSRQSLNAINITFHLHPLLMSSQNTSQYHQRPSDTPVHVRYTLSSLRSDVCTLSEQGNCISLCCLRRL